MNCHSLAEWKTKSNDLSLTAKVFYENHFSDADNGEIFNKSVPFDREKTIIIARGGKKDIDKAVAAAQKAFYDGWGKIPATTRKKKLLKWIELMKKNADTLALLETMDMGKPIYFSQTEDIASGIDHFQWMAEASDKIYDDITPQHRNYIGLLRREPLGVVGSIVPWNYPFMMMSWKIAPALAAGNTVVLKPSEKSPLSALYLAKLWVEADLPPGVFNVVPGFGPEAGDSLAHHPDVKCLAFTGSTITAKKLLIASANSNMKRIWIEAGGKSPVLIFPDADIQKAVASVAESIFYNQGEVCIANSRLIVTPEVKEKIMPLLVEEAKNWIPGHPLDPKTMAGAVVDHIQFDRIHNYIEKGKREAQWVSLGDLGERGKFIDSSDFKKGFYVLPTIFDGVKNNMTIAREEIFGPVLSVITVNNEEEMVKVANDTTYGLGATLWTRDIIKAERIASTIESGTIWINCWGDGDAAMPFGGLKESGFGRDKSLHAFEKYTDIKAMVVGKKN